MSTASRVIKNTGFLYAKMGITMFISLYSTRLILNSLGAEDFGIFNIVGGSIAMLGFLNAAMASATQRFMSYAEGEGNLEKQKNIFNVSFILHFGIALLAGVILLIAGYYFFNGILNIPDNRMYAARMIYYFMIVSTMFTIMTVPYDAVLNAHENMKYYAIVGILESVLKLSAAIIVVHTFTDKLILYGALMASISMIVMLIMRLYCHKHYTECLIAPRKYWHRKLMREMTGFAGWNFLGTVSSLIGNYGMGVVLNHFFGTLLNAAQGIANQLNGQLLVFSNNMLKALNPVIAKSEGENNRKKMLEVSLTGCKFSFYMLAFFAIPAILEMPYILKIWLKNIPVWTIVFARLQIIKSLIEQMTIVFGNSIAAEGRIAKFNTTAAIINLVPLVLIYNLFSLGFSPIFMYVVNISLFGVALSWLKVYFMHRNCGLPYRLFFRKIFTPIIIVFGCVFLFSSIPLFFMAPSFIRLIIVIGVSIVSFFFFFWTIGTNSQEKQILHQFILKLEEFFARKKANRT